MKTTEALSFLRDHQPLPSDQGMPPDLIAAYDEVRKSLLAAKEPECIPLLLGSFGDGSGFGVYQLVEDVLLQFPSEEVVPHLVTKLESNHRGVRYWCAQIAASFPDERLIFPLSRLLKDSDADIRVMAAIALGRIGGQQVRELLRDALRSETDGDVTEAIQEELGERG